MPSCGTYIYTHLHINARVSPVSRRCGRIEALCVCACALVGYYGESVGGWVDGRERMRDITAVYLSY